MAIYDNSANVAADLIFKFLKDRMKEKKITQLQLSELIGINESTLIRNFKKESEMSLSTLLKICGALEIRPYLVEAENDDNDMDRVHFN